MESNAVDGQMDGLMDVSCMECAIQKDNFAQYSMKWSMFGDVTNNFKRSKFKEVLENCLYFSMKYLQNKN